MELEINRLRFGGKLTPKVFLEYLYQNELKTLELLTNYGLNINENVEEIFLTNRRWQSFFYGSLLTIACREGKLSLVYWLLDQGADLESRDQDENTPLLIACKHGNYEIVRCFEARGVDLRANNRFQSNVLLEASKSTSKELIEYLLSHPTTCDMLYLSDQDGQTPLMIACRAGNIDFVRLFLQHSIDIEALDKFGNNAISLANIFGFLDIVNLLTNK